MLDALRAYEPTMEKQFYDKLRQLIWKQMTKHEQRYWLVREAYRSEDLTLDPQSFDRVAKVLGVSYHTVRKDYWNERPKHHKQMQGKDKNFAVSSPELGVPTLSVNPPVRKRRRSQKRRR